MIASLSKFDNITAAGILARAAISLEDKENPAAANKIPDESFIRDSILHDIRTSLGIGLDDMSHEAISKVSEFLDQESDNLLGDTNNSEVFERLSDNGELPSDLYEVEVLLNINNFYGKKYDAEKKFIEDTIRLPDQEQHYGKPQNPNDPFLISLFAKFFPAKYPNNSFTMLVAAERRGIKLIVHQAWRIYKDSLCLDGVSDLVDMLRKFAEKFGAKIKFRNKVGHFFLVEDIDEESSLDYEIEVVDLENQKHKKKTISEIVVTHFIQTKPFGSKKQAALLIAIDLVKYRNLLKSHGW